MSWLARALLASALLGVLSACERPPTPRPPLGAREASDARSARPQPDTPAAVVVDTILFPPAVFSVLPAATRRALDERGCLVPRPSFRRSPSNVIVGSFARPGQVDWAVLCWREQRSSILVFWGGPSDCPAELASVRDSVPGRVAPRGWYDHVITAADARHGGIGEWPAAPFPPQDQLDHWGIEDGWDMTSSVWYCYAGQWWRLPGSD